MTRIAVLVLGLALAACGGSGLDEVLEDAGDLTPAVDDDGGTGGDDGEFDIGAGEAGPVTATADPSMAWIEVDGERADFSAIDMDRYECAIADDRVTINYQTNEGPGILVQGSVLEEGWLLNFTYVPDSEQTVQISTTMPGDGTLGLEDGQLSYEGPMDRIVDRDLLNPEPVSATVAINCGLPEAQPELVLGDAEYVVSMVGAATAECDVSDDSVAVEINRLVTDDLNVSIDVEAADGGWSGIVAVTTPEGSFISVDSPNPVGLTVDGSTVTYEGTFSGDAGDREGTLTVPCP